MKQLLEAIAPGHGDFELARRIDPARVPAHIAIIMDGNGRWAAQRGLPRAAGHKAGVPSVRSTVETCAQMGVKVLTLYAFSAENWKRPRLEVDMLWQLLRLYLRQEIGTMNRNGVRLGAIGRLEALPAEVRAELRDVIAETSKNNGLLLNLAINYGGRSELVDAVRKLVEAAAAGNIEINEDAIASRLYTAGLPDPDLLVRTSGEMRVSNFLLWQIAYAELYVTETLWPDFNRTEFLRAILEYQRRDRRFGGLGQQPANRTATSERDLETASVSNR
jgi:undecaprenyl diphosphate synthase